MGRSYHQFCPIAHALDLIGERWSLLVVRELIEAGALRYSDLNARLDGCGTNILAARLKALEQGGVIRKRRLDPPAASWVYELTEYGEGLRPVLHQLAHWGARSLEPPSAADLEPGWLAGALQIAMPTSASACRVEFRIGDEVASIVDGAVVEGTIDSPDAVVTGDASGFYRLLVERNLQAVTITGSNDVISELLAALPPGPGASVEDGVAAAISPT